MSEPLVPEDLQELLRDHLESIEQLDVLSLLRDAAPRVWSADDGKKVAELAGHGEHVFAVAFHPDGKSLVSGDLKGVVKHWDVATGKCGRDLDAKVLFLVSRLQDTGGVRWLQFDPKGETLACAGTKPTVGANGSAARTAS